VCQKAGRPQGNSSKGEVLETGGGRTTGGSHERLPKHQDYSPQKRDELKVLKHGEGPTDKRKGARP